MSQIVGQIVVTVTARVEVPPLFRLRAKIANVLVGLAKRLVDCNVTVAVNATYEPCMSPAAAKNFIKQQSKIEKRRHKSVARQRP